LQLSGKVIAFARYPKSIDLFGTIDEDISVKHTIVPDPKFKFDIVRTYANDGQYIDFSLEKQKSQFTLTVKNKKKTEGRYYDRIHLVTDSDVQKEITIRVQGRISKPKNIKNESQKN
jgi:hypothetical protein